MAKSGKKVGSEKKGTKGKKKAKLQEPKGFKNKSELDDYIKLQIKGQPQFKDQSERDDYDKRQY